MMAFSKANIFTEKEEKKIQILFMTLLTLVVNTINDIWLPK